MKDNQNGWKRLIKRSDGRWREIDLEDKSQTGKLKGYISMNSKIFKHELIDDIYEYFELIF